MLLFDSSIDDEDIYVLCLMFRTEFINDFDLNEQQL